MDPRVAALPRIPRLPGAPRPVEKRREAAVAKAAALPARPTSSSGSSVRGGAAIAVPATLRHSTPAPGAAPVARHADFIAATTRRFDPAALARHAAKNQPPPRPADPRLPPQPAGRPTRASAAPGVRPVSQGRVRSGREPATSKRGGKLGSSLAKTVLTPGARKAVLARKDPRRITAEQMPVILERARARKAKRALQQQQELMRDKWSDAAAAAETQHRGRGPDAGPSRLRLESAAGGRRAPAPAQRPQLRLATARAAEQAQAADLLARDPIRQAQTRGITQKQRRHSDWRQRQHDAGGRESDDDTDDDDDGGFDDDYAEELDAATAEAAAINCDADAQESEDDHGDGGQVDPDDGLDASDPEEYYNQHYSSIIQGMFRSTSSPRKRRRPGDNDGDDDEDLASMEVTAARIEQEEAETLRQARIEEDIDDLQEEVREWKRQKLEALASRTFASPADKLAAKMHVLRQAKNKFDLGRAKITGRHHRRRRASGRD